MLFLKFLALDLPAATAAKKLEAALRLAGIPPLGAYRESVVGPPPAERVETFLAYLVAASARPAAIQQVVDNTGLPLLAQLPVATLPPPAAFAKVEVVMFCAAGLEDTILPRLEQAILAAEEDGYRTARIEARPLTLSDYAQLVYSNSRPPGPHRYEVPLPDPKA